MLHFYVHAKFLSTGAIYAIKLYKVQYLVGTMVEMLNITVDITGDLSESLLLEIDEHEKYSMTMSTNDMYRALIKTIDGFTRNNCVIIWYNGNKMNFTNFSNIFDIERWSLMNVEFFDVKSMITEYRIPMNVWLYKFMNKFYKTVKDLVDAKMMLDLVPRSLKSTVIFHLRRNTSSKHKELINTLEFICM